METAVLKRDCPAIVIPSGDHITLAAGASVEVSQTLGGAFTVYTEGRLARIDGKDADALGLEPNAVPVPAPSSTPGGRVDEKHVWDQLRTCFDPEIPVNIVDLGLIYDLQVIPLPEGGNRVDVKMTLTAPGCSMGGVIAQDAENKIRGVPNVTDVHVELVWDPPWNQAMLSEAARLQLGLM
jgi:probable FeS assembly SUF system protein SufT